MKGLFAVLAFTILTALSWGVYGPVLNKGQEAMGAKVEGKELKSRLRPFICVGLAYFVIAVTVPGALLGARGEVGHWSATGTIWSLLAGAAGAIGALGIIMAFTFRGSPLYVMPLVFGGAPVVNTFFTMFTGKTYKEAGPLFFAGLIVVVSGAVAVLVFGPGHSPKKHDTTEVARAAEEPPKAAPHAADLTATQFALVALSVALTALSWGVYGPVLHKGQLAMAGSRLRPLICVGLAYFLIAVLIPVGILTQFGEPGQWTTTGVVWSLAGGAAGAIGALGIILAFNFGGKPIYVMPLVFGGAPVVSTLYTLLSKGVSGSLNPIFYAGLIMVAVGAVTVLIFAPKGHPPARHAPPKPASEPAPSAT